jgi:GT2 family glycosyltransferase
VEHLFEGLGGLMPKKVTVGIPVYNRGARLADLLENIRQRTSNEFEYEIVVVDDSGNQGHQGVVKKSCSRYGATFVAHGKNRGVAAGWNTIAQYGNDSEFVAILNDDVFVANDWLRYLMYALRENPGVGSFGMSCRFISQGDAPEILKGPNSKVLPLNVRYRGAELIKNERFLSMPAEEDGAPGRVMCPTGCFFGFRREIYNLVGGFDERYFAFYEETDFGVACARLGYPSFVLGVPDHNYHMWSASFASAPEIKAGSIMARSRSLFVDKWSKILGVKFSDAPEIHSLLMDKIPSMKVKWLGLGKVERSEIL